MVASFPGPAQLFVTCSTEKRERAWYLSSHDHDKSSLVPRHSVISPGNEARRNQEMAKIF